VLATFHSRLGYARPWPSAIPGSCRTGRDFLGETIAATKAAGMRTILYMTDDPQWFNQGLGSGQSWLNSSAYSSFKGHNVDLTTRDGGLDLCVRDNGSGFDTDGPPTGLGLNGMAERARLVGGELSVYSEPGSGTSVTLHVP